MQACIVGITVGSLGPKIGADRREQVAKERSGVFALRTRVSAMVWCTLVSSVESGVAGTGG